MENVFTFNEALAMARKDLYRAQNYEDGQDMLALFGSALEYCMACTIYICKQTEELAVISICSTIDKWAYDHDLNPLSFWVRLFIAGALGSISEADDLEPDEVSKYLDLLKELDEKMGGQR